MTTWAKLLGYLERPEIDALVLRSEAPIVVMAKTRAHPLTAAPLRHVQLLRLLEGTAIVDILRSGDTAFDREIELAGHRVRCIGNLSGGALELTFERPRAPEPALDSAFDDDDRLGPPSVSLGDHGIRFPASGTSSSATSGSASTSTAAVDDHYEREFAPEDLDSPRGAGGDVGSGRLANEFTMAELDQSPSTHSSQTLPSVPPRHPSQSTVLPRSPAAAASPVPSSPAAAAPTAPRPPASVIAAANVAAPAAPRIGVVGSNNAAIDAALATARRSRASDIHLQAGQPVRIRVAGALRPTGAPLTESAIEAAVLPWLSPKQREQLEREGYTDLAVDHAAGGRLRVNIGRGRVGLKVSMRVIASEPPTLESLRMPDGVRKLEQHHQGLAIFSGPSGHGKTTSMAAVINMFNNMRPMHIITVEDPVEIVHPVSRAVISQREVGSHTMSFQRALKGALREDPDIIAIGELRDRETVEMALSAAETGHLVVATMSTPSAAKTLGRLIDMFPPDDQEQVRATLAGALKLIVSQRLLRLQTGEGMVAAYETLVGSIALWSLIRDNKLFQLPSLLQRGKAYGMVRLEDSLRELVDQGLVDRKEAARYSGDRAATPELKMASNE